MLIVSCNRWDVALLLKNKCYNNYDIHLDLKKQIRCLENEIGKLKYLCTNYCQEINDLQQQLAEKTFQLLDLKGITKAASKSQGKSIFKKSLFKSNKSIF